MNYRTTLTFLFLALALSLAAQGPGTSSPRAIGGGDTAYTFVEIGLGYGVVQFGDGLETRADAGGFGSPGGGLFSIGVFRKFAWLPNAALGMRYKNSGGSPTSGNGGDEMFFNYWLTSFAARWYPFDAQARRGVYLQPEYVFVTQFTQKYRNEARQVYDHQFAIGSGATVGLGYTYPVGKRSAAIELGLEVDFVSRQGEVTDVGEVSFSNTAIGGMARLRF